MPGHDAAGQDSGCRGSAVFHNVDLAQGPSCERRADVVVLAVQSASVDAGTCSMNICSTGCIVLPMHLADHADNAILHGFPIGDKAWTGPVPATSPENCFLVNGELVSVAQSSDENATAIVRNLLDDLIQASHDLEDLDEGQRSGP